MSQSSKPKKKAASGKKSASKKKSPSGSAAPVGPLGNLEGWGNMDEVPKEELVERVRRLVSELEQERQERNYFQLERVSALFRC
jgi:hypothetical protein